MAGIDREQRREALAPTGVIGAGRSDRLNEAERQALRGKLQHILRRVRDQEDLFYDLANAAYYLRERREIGYEATIRGREEDLDQAIQAVKSGREVRLNGKNRPLFDALRRKFPAAPDVDLLHEARQRLPRLGKGRAPDFALLGTAVELAHLFPRYFGKPPSSSKDGNYLALLEAIAQVALGKEFNGLHSLAERALRIPVTDYGNGSLSYSLV